MFADLLAIIVTWRKTYKTSQLVAETGCGPSLSKVMLNSGIVYFCSLAALNILDVVLGVVGIQVQTAGNGTYVVIFVDPLSSLLICRFLLDLRSVSERLADGSSGSVSSLNFGGVGVRPQVPSNNPSFLDSLAGSVQFPSAPEEDEATPAPMEHLNVIPAAAPSGSPVA
ncbi:hypothetical protein BD413DRAFT_608133 [Trametes elegans]|nr:hypothetical protein BD413DRAFT_608133 [Trametes elegans]